MPKLRNKLTDRQRRVIDFYYGPANLDKTAALRMGGYTYPEKAHVFYKRPAVVQEMDRREARFRKKYEVTYDRVAEEIAKIAYFTPLSVFSFNQDTGYYELDLGRADIHEMAALGEIKVKERWEDSGEVDKKGDVIKIKVTQVFVKPWNKLKALESLMRHAGISKQKDPTIGVVDLAGRIRRAREQAGGSDGDD